jgi:hypothetical protein
MFKKIIFILGLINGLAVSCNFSEIPADSFSSSNKRQIEVDIKTTVSGIVSHAIPKSFAGAKVSVLIDGKRYRGSFSLEELPSETLRKLQAGEVTVFVIFQ